MAYPLDPDSISHGIQLAVAPVFLLTAVAGMIGAVATRLARIIDRARTLEDRIKHGELPNDHADYRDELTVLRKRGMLANAAIGLLTLCGFLIGVTIMVLFLGEATNFQGIRISIVGFLSGVVCFLSALACFFLETLIATRMLDFGKSHS
jgi:hypothetical protein